MELGLSAQAVCSCAIHPCSLCMLMSSADYGRPWGKVCHEPVCATYTTIWPCPWVDIGLGQYLSACSLNCSVYLTSGLWFHVFLFLPYPFLSHLHNQDWTWNVVLFYLLAFFMYCFSVIWTLLYCFSLWESN